ncbi:ABC transporter substrate-binding protein [Falsiroseomonas ponticola]|uniref:ABC transporter substrate-binding protein n=1 Tax=Falsiroseomonas ponticola TaxID=2786951 RepID=UPI001932F9B3|nr:ABC transporter substrate-binding protein [Roseomonas ponticola]
MKDQGVGRRALLQGAAGMAVALPAGGALAQAAAREAPDVAAAVQQGRLPPLEQRIGSAPLVVTPNEANGRYGGTLRRGLRGGSDHNGILRLIGNQGLTRWNMEFTDVLPCVAQRWDVSADSKEFVFHLRPGMRWSDGAPFTADDILFAINDCILNTELYRSPPSMWVIDGQPVKCEKVSDTAVKFTFAGPYGLFLQQMATPLGQHPTLFAKHYCGRFHPKYNADLAATLRQANVSDWAQLFRQRCGDIEIPSRWGNAEKPTLDPWVVEEPYQGGATRVTMRRNPFFWQVDNQGRQLPYIDRLNFQVYQDVESLMLDVIGGRLDLQERHIDVLANKPVVAQNMQRGNYRMFDTINAGSTSMMIYPNITHKDPKIREMLGNKEFRQALSLGINRPEIVDIVYLGQSEPWQTGPRPTHPWYHEKLSRQFTEHNTREANRILDRIGYARRDSQRFRLRPDGQRVFFAIDVITALYPDNNDALELIKRHWAEIGIDVKINTIDRSLYYTRGDNNDHDIAVWPGPGGLEPMLDPRDFFAMHTQGTRYAVPWAMWYASGGRDGQEPPDHQKERMRLYDQARSTADTRRQGELMKRVFDICADQFECIGVNLAPNLFGVAQNRLRGVPASMPYSWSWPHPGPSLPQQFFFTS